LRFDLVLFDLDGTLVDSLPDIASALNRALAEVGLPPLPLDVVRTLVGEGVLRLAEKALVTHQASHLDAAALARRVVSIYEERPCVETRLYAGMEQTLRALQTRGVKLGVLTNKMGSVARKLIAALGLAEVFDVVVGDGDGYARKPAPDAARALFEKFGVAPGSALMVGDGLPDLAMARAAGCASAGVTWGYVDRRTLEAERPDFLVDAPSQLLTIV
jgi:phosphoglycolate phosphatase